MSVSHRGKQRSAEHCRKLSEAHVGKRPSPEACAKISATLTGRHPSSEVREKLSLAQKKLWQNPDFKERRIRATLKGTQVRPTLPELKVQSILDCHFPGEWKYVGNGEVVIGGKNPDIININGQKAVVEVFGDYWHGEKRTGMSNEQAVANRVAHFAKYGFRCAVIWEHEVKDERTVLGRLAKEFVLPEGVNS